MQCRHKHNIIALLQLVCCLAFEFPVRIVNEHEHARSTVEYQLMFSTAITATGSYTESSSTNISFRGSFIRFSQSQSMRKPTVAGFSSSCVAGMAILCFRLFEKSISRPPLIHISHRLCYLRRVATNLNSTSRSIVAAIIERLIAASQDILERLHVLLARLELYFSGLEEKATEKRSDLYLHPSKFG